jgi:hypothetical protein
MMLKQSLSIRVICTTPPILKNTDTARFGLQDKNKQLLEGNTSSTGTLVYEFMLDVKQHTDNTPNFTGAYAHGSRSERFLYLTLMLKDTEWEINRRIKIPLKTIIWEQVQILLEDDSKVLQAKVSGESSGTVPLFDDGWSIENC